jgi:protein-disulfide isomerase
MPHKVKRDIGLIIAIVFASTVVSGSLVFFGMQYAGGAGDDYLAKRIEEGIEKYAEKKYQQAIEEQELAAASEAVKNSDKAKLVSKLTERDHVFGEKDSKITLIEYSDFQCPFCTRFHATAKQLVDFYKGEVNWVYRHYPLGFHDPVATQQAVASECVAEVGGNDKFWEYAELLFDVSDGSSVVLAELASQIGVDKKKVTDCISSGRYEAIVKADVANAEDMGIRGTPATVVLNNETGDAMMVEGALPFDRFKNVIDDILSQ